MRFVGARVAGSLPFFEGPGLTGGASAALGRGRSSCAGANGCPVRGFRGFTAERLQVRLRKDGGSGAGQDSVVWDHVKASEIFGGNARAFSRAGARACRRLFCEHDFRALTSPVPPV